MRYLAGAGRGKSRTMTNMAMLCENEFDGIAAVPITFNRHTELSKDDYSRIESDYGFIAWEMCSRCIYSRYGENTSLKKVKKYLVMEEFIDVKNEKQAGELICGVLNKMFGEKRGVVFLVDELKFFDDNVKEGLTDAAMNVLKEADDYGRDGENHWQKIVVSTLDMSFVKGDYMSSTGSTKIRIIQLADELKYREMVKNEWFSEFAEAGGAMAGAVRTLVPCLNDLPRALQYLSKCFRDVRDDDNLKLDSQLHLVRHLIKSVKKELKETYAWRIGHSANKKILSIVLTGSVSKEIHVPVTETVGMWLTDSYLFTKHKLIGHKGEPHLKLEEPRAVLAAMIVIAHDDAIEKAYEKDKLLFEGMYDAGYSHKVMSALKKMMTLLIDSECIFGTGARKGDLFEELAFLWLFIRLSLWSNKLRHDLRKHLPTALCVDEMEIGNYLTGMKLKFATSIVLKPGVVKAGYLSKKVAVTPTKREKNTKKKSRNEAVKRQMEENIGSIVVWHCADSQIWCDVMIQVPSEKAAGKCNLLCISLKSSWIGNEHVAQLKKTMEAWDDLVESVEFAALVSSNAPGKELADVAHLDFQATMGPFARFIETMMDNAHTQHPK